MQYNHAERSYDKILPTPVIHMAANALKYSVIIREVVREVNGSAYQFAVVKPREQLVKQSSRPSSLPCL